MRRVFAELRALLATELVGLAVKIDARAVYEMARSLVVIVERDRKDAT